MLPLDWNAAKDVLRASLPLTQYKNWLSPVELIRYDDRAVVLGVPSRFHEQWLQSHYRDKLVGAIKRQCGNELQLEFEILSVNPSRNPEAFEPSLDDDPATNTLRSRLRVIENEPAPAEITEAVTEPYHPNLPAITNPFFEAEHNRLALKCAEMFAKGDEFQVNPLIVFAGVGMGKTHLLTHIGQLVQHHHPHARVRYVNFDSFGSEYVDAIKANDSNAVITFKKKYRHHTDILLFDDLQGLSGWKKTQEELLHVFNEITSHGGRIAFTTTIPPHRIEGLSESLKSRILSGVIAEIKYPSYTERVAMLEKTCGHYGIVAEPSVLRTLASQGQKDIRELMGTLLRIHLQAKLENQPLNHQLLSREGYTQEPQKATVTLDEIISLVEYNFGIPRSVLGSKSRKESVSWSRQVAMYLARRYTLLPLEEIGKAFGRDHATVIHAFQKVSEKMDRFPSHRYEVEFLDQKLKSRLVGSGPMAPFPQPLFSNEAPLDSQASPPATQEPLV